MNKFKVSLDDGQIRIFDADYYNVTTEGDVEFFNGLPTDKDVIPLGTVARDKWNSVRRM